MKTIFDLIKLLFGINNNSISEEDINMLKCEKLYWLLNCVIEMAVYVKNSTGRNSTYCNVSSYDALDSRCTAVWNVMVKEGESVERLFPMGNTVKGLDYDLRPLFPNNDVNDVLNAPIQDVEGPYPGIFNQALIEASKGTVRRVSQKEAQEKANKGIPILILSKKFNHVAIVAPHLIWNDELGKMELFPYDEEKGCFTMNAGAHNDMMYLGDKRGFGYYYDWKDPEAIIFIQLRQYATGEFDD